MADINFPSSPTTNQQYSFEGKTWVWNGYAWQVLPNTDSGILTAKGDLLTRTSSALTRLPAGTNGDLLVANSNATEGISWQTQLNTGRNFVINGGMQILQRGLSTTGITTTGYYTADRWRTFVNTGTWTQTIENNAPTGTGLRNSLKLLCTTAVTSLAANAQTTINQRLIGRDLQSIRKGTSSAQKLTLSFWVKSNVTGTYVVDIFDDDNTRNVSATYTISAADTWENKTITFPEDTGGSILTMDSNVSLQPIFWLVAGTDYTSAGVLQTTWGAATASSRAVGQLNLAAATNNYYQITGIQMETGSIATAFEFEPYERTLSKCHFYYYRATVDTIGDHFGSGFNKTTTAGMFYTPFPGRMRAAPTALEQSGTATDYAIAHANTSTACSSVPTFESATVSGASTNFTVSSGLTAGQGSMAKADTTNAYLAWSAEL